MTIARQPHLALLLCFTALACQSGETDDGGSSTTGSGSATASGGASLGGAGSANSGSGSSSAGGAGATASTGGASGGSLAGSGSATSGGAANGTGGAADPTCSQGVWDGGTPEVLTLSGNKFAHDPTMIEADGVFYRFWTGDNVPMATSTDMKNWKNGPAVYTGGYAPWVQSWLDGVSGETFNFPWAPDVSRFGGQFHIYSTFSAKFGDNISCITHLTTQNIAQGGWTDHGPVICTQGNESYNAIDADAAVDQSGTPYLAFGSFWDGIMGLELKADGSRANDEVTRLAWANQIEAPVLFYRCGYYYLFVTWGLCCPGEGRTVDQLTYRVAVGRATSILGPYYDKNGVAMVDGGGTLLVEGDHVQWAAAGHSDVIATGDEIYHLFHAYRQSDGGAELRIVELPFDDEGWPVPGGP